MATHQPPSAPSPDTMNLFIHMVTWVGQQAWAIVILVVIGLWRAVFGNINDRLKGVESGQEKIHDVLTKIQIDMAEVKGELKGRKPTK